VAGRWCPALRKQDRQPVQADNRLELTTIYLSSVRCLRGAAERSEAEQNTEALHLWRAVEGSVFFILYTVRFVLA